MNLLCSGIHSAGGFYHTLNVNLGLLIICSWSLWVGAFRRGNRSGMTIRRRIRIRGERLSWCRFWLLRIHGIDNNPEPACRSAGLDAGALSRPRQQCVFRKVDDGKIPVQATGPLENRSR